MIYTTYLSKIKSIPDNTVKILIMRYKPKWLYKYNDDIAWEPLLAPRMFDEYKFDNNISKQELFDDYYDYLENSEIPSKVTSKIIDYIKEGKNVCFICCEKELYDCHRRVLAEYISKKTNVEWKEL